MAIALEKGLQLLRGLAHAPEGRVGVRQMARELGLTPSSAHGLLGGLCRQGFAEKTADGHYALGPAAFTLTAGHDRYAYLLRWCQRAVDVIHAGTSETAAAVAWIDGRAVVLAKRQSPYQLIADMPAGIVATPHDWASGLVLLAMCSDEECKQYADDGGITQRRLRGLLKDHVSDDTAEVADLHDSGVRALAIGIRPLRLALAVSAPLLRLDRAACTAALEIMRTERHRLLGQEEEQSDA